MKKIIFTILVLNIISCSSINKESSNRRTSSIFGDNEMRSVKNIEDPNIISNFEAIALVFEKKKGLSPYSGFGSGFIFHYLNNYYLITNNHVIPNQEVCSNSQLVRGYNHFSLKKAVLSMELVDEYSKKFFIRRNKDGSIPEHYYTKIPLDLEKYSASINSGHSFLQNCEKVLISNKKLDFTITKISDPLNSKILNSNLFSFDLNKFPQEIINKENIYNLHHADGKPLQISDNCYALIKRNNLRYIDDYIFKLNCDGYRGASGSPILSISSNYPIGIKTNGLGDEDSLNQVEVPHNIESFLSKASSSVALPLLLPAVKAFLENSTSPLGIFGYRGGWMSLDGSIYIRNEDYKLKKSETNKIKRIISVVKRYLTENKLSRKYLEFSYYEESSRERKEYELLSTDSDSVIYEKIKNVDNYILSI